MLGHLRNGIVPVLILAAFAAGAPPGADAQEPRVVSSQITVSGTEATLEMELSGGGDLTVALQNGRLLLNGEEAGRLQAGGPLEAAWRELLGRAIATEPAALDELLLGWEPPAAMPADASAAAAALSDRFDTVLGPGSPQVPANVLTGAGTASDLGALVWTGPRLRLLAQAVEELGMDGPLETHVRETVRVPAGETLESSLVSVDGQLLVDGTIDGDVVLLGGSLELGPEARVTGSVRWADARVVGSTSGVTGGVERIAVTESVSTSSNLADRSPIVDIRDEIRREVEAAREAEGSRGGLLSPLRNIGQGIAGLFQTFVTFGILFALGLGVLYFFPRQIEVVARTARTVTGRAALVGAAGLVLACPVWVVGTALLAVSIVGIPALLIWVPGVPLAVAISMPLGYLAVARSLGQWLSGRGIGALGRLDQTRPAVHVGVGITMLLAAFALAHVFEMAGGWLRPFEVMFQIIGMGFTALAICIGVGAIVLSRAGRDPAYAGPGWGPTGDEGLET